MLILPSFASATTEIAVDNITTSCAAVSLENPSEGWAQEIDPSFSFNRVEINDLAMHYLGISPSSLPMGETLTIELYTDDGTDVDTIVSGWSQTFSSDGIFEDGGSGTDWSNKYDFYVEGPTQASGNYWVAMRWSATANQLRSCRGPNVETFLRSAETDDSWATVGINTSNDMGAQFIISDEGGGTLPPEITDPEDEEILESGIFGVAGTCDDTEGFTRVTVDAFTASGVFVTFVDAECIGGVFDSTVGAYATQKYALWDGDFLLKAKASDGSSFTIYGDAITVTVGGSGIPPPPVPQEDLTDDCDTETGTIERALCFFAVSTGDLLTWLFVPSSDSLAGISGTWDLIKNKPPIGYFYVASDAIGALSQGSSSIELDGTDDLSDYFDPIKDTITASFWLLAVIYTFNRIRTLDI